MSSTQPTATSQPRQFFTSISQIESYFRRLIMLAKGALSTMQLMLNSVERQLNFNSIDHHEAQIICRKAITKYKVGIEELVILAAKEIAQLRRQLEQKK